MSAGAKDANRLKEEGNEEFKKEKYEAAVELYTQAIECIEGETAEKAICYKNRAAAYLKMNNFHGAVGDASRALAITPNDPKALYRRSLAYEGLERYEDAYKDARAALTDDPGNNATQKLLSKLHDIINKRFHENNLLKNKVKQMFEIAFDMNADRGKRDSAFNNLLVLATERAGSEAMWAADVISKLVAAIKDENNDFVFIHSIRIMSELIKSNLERVKEILMKFGIPWFLELMNSKKEERVNVVQYLLQNILNTLSGLSNKPDSKPVKELCEKNKSEIDAMLTGIAFVTTSRGYSGLARDAVIELVARNVHYSTLNWAETFVGINGLHRLLEVASEMEEYEYESAMEVTANTHNIVAVCLTRIYENMYYDEARQRYTDQVDEFVKEKLLAPDLESKVRAVIAITTLLAGPLDVGNSILAREGIIEMVLAMASTDDILQQKVACECIIAASAKKDKIATLVHQGASILKKLYNSKDTAVKVRALVGLCKLGASGGTDASNRPFADGATLKLADACRKYLVNPAKYPEIRRWAAEGLSYLTLDAEVKEKLIEDKTALHALMDLAKTGGQNAVYGIITTFVNLSNAYDKEEILPEMLELAKFAKHHIPQEHELDDPDFVVKRLEILVNEGITSALVNLSKTESHSSKELISRVFNAVCALPTLRGTVVQQGGAKALLQLASEGTEKGKRHASQALARIGISIDPMVSFPGQRIYEVIRPFLSLLHPDYKALENFEALLALCNIASVSDSVRKRIIKENGVSKIEMYMYEEHIMLKRAAVQAMTNLIVDEEVVNIYEGDNDKTKFLFLLCGDDDEQTALAAVGAMAMLTSCSAKCCEKIFECGEWLELLKCALANPNKEVKHRGLVLVINVMNSSAKLAERLMSSIVMEILIALTRTENEVIVSLANRALRIAENFRLIQRATGEDLPVGNLRLGDDPDMPALE